MSPQAQTLDDLMTAHGAIVAPKPAAADPLDALMSQHGAIVPDFTSTNQKDASGNATAASSIGTFARHVGAQINPVAAVQSLGRAVLHPIDTVKGIGAAQGAVFDKAKASYEQGDYGTAARHFVDYLLPLVGPAIDQSADEMQRGNIAAGAGDAVGIGLSMFGPKAIGQAAATRAARPATPTPSNPQAGAVAFGRQRGIPVDAATATNNMGVRGVQAMADRSIAGSIVAAKAGDRQAAALTRVGGELADTARGVAVTTEQAGQGIRDALTSRIQAHTDLADVAYDKLRALEQAPTNRMDVPLPKTAPVDAIPDGLKGQLRRIVHELDAMPFTKRLLRPSGVGGSLEHVEGTGGAGAKVFDHVLENLPGTYRPTRGAMQAQIEMYLGGGKETPIVRSALDVATARSKAQGSPELPPSAMEIPTRLEAKRATSTEMGFPVDTTTAKKALQPVYDQMTRQMPITQQQANPGLKAIQNILEGPDWAPLSQVDRDLSAIKSIARSQGGLAKLAVATLDGAVRKAAAGGGPDVLQTLQQARGATVAKYQAADVLDALRAEPVGTFRQMTAPKDSGIALLRAVKEQAPQAMPQIARAKLDDLLALATEKGGFDHADKLYAEWQKLGSETKRLLFPKPAEAQALDYFFLLAKKLATNPNPSGTGQAVMRLSEGGALFTNPLAFIVAEAGAAGLSAILHASRGVPVLTRATSIALRPQIATAAQRAATAAELLRVAESAGVRLTLPSAASTEPRW